MICSECGEPHSLPLDADCPSCGEVVGATCRDCGNLFDVSELEDGLDEHCAEVRKRVARRERLDAIREGRGDYMRDQRKDERLTIKIWEPPRTDNWRASRRR